MKTNKGIILALAIGVVFGLTTAYGNASEGWKSFSKGTAFEDHSDGTYGPVGLGGFGMPDLNKTKDAEPAATQNTVKRPLFQDIQSGTSFQGHRDGTYGPVGAGGYGMPDLKKAEKSVRR